MLNAIRPTQVTASPQGFWCRFQSIRANILSRPSLRGQLKGLVLLLLSSALSGLCFTYLASRRWRALDAEAVLFTVTYTQWVTLGVTLAKLGLDTYLFALVTADPRLRIDMHRFSLRYSAPISIGMGLVLIPVFGLAPALLLSITVLSDSASVLLSAQMTALRHYSYPATASLLKYPLFFLFLVCLSFITHLHALQVASVLCLGSLLRVAYLATRHLPPGEKVLDYKPSLWIAVHHPLNLVLFKADQLTLPLFGATAITIRFQQYAYLTKWPELVSGLTSTVGVVFLPTLYCKVRDLQISLLQHKWIKWLLILYAVGVCAATFTYCIGFNGAPPTRLVLPFSLAIALILPVNLGTYTLLRHSCLKVLIRNLILSLLCGLFVCGTAWFTRSALILSCAVPIQLTVFLTLFLAKPPGTQTLSNVVAEADKAQTI